MQKVLQLVVFAFVLSLSATANAQTIIFEELFNDGTLGQFTAYSVIGDNQVWIPSEFDGKQFAQMNGYDSGIQDNEDWLISPALDMDAYTDEVLTFENACNFDGLDLEVLVSTDYDGSSDPNSATWTDLSGDVTWSTGDYIYVESGELDLSSFTGTGYIAFKYISNATVAGKLWQVDSVIVRTAETTNLLQVKPQLQLIDAPRVQSELLTFDVVAESKEIDFALYAVNGQLMDQFSIYQTGTVEHSVANLATGVYVLKAWTDEGYQTVKFFKD